MLAGGDKRNTNAYMLAGGDKRNTTNQQTDIVNIAVGEPISIKHHTGPSLTGPHAHPVSLHLSFQQQVFVSTVFTGIVIPLVTAPIGGGMSLQLVPKSLIPRTEVPRDSSVQIAHWPFDSCSSFGSL